MSVTLADPYRDYTLDYSQHAKAEGHEDAITYQTPQSHIQQHKETNSPYPQGSSHSTAYEQHHASATVLPAANPDISQTVVLTPIQMLPRQVPVQYTPSNFEIPPLHHSRKRPLSEAERDGNHGDHGVRPHLSALSSEAHPEATHTPGMLFSVHSDSSQQAPPQHHHHQQHQQHQQHQHRHHQQLSSHGFGPPESMALPQQHHHHRLPPQASVHSGQRHGMDPELSPAPSGPPSVVGQPGMPDPAPRPKGPKLKFTPEEDALLVDLKENKNLTWKQIADFFPGRTSGTLQVRYCTKLKAKDVTWTDEMVERLERAIQDYENDRWRIIAGKVGNGFTPAACREKASQF